MGFFVFPNQPDINRGVREFQDSAGAILLDVRTPREYREGHIPGSQNVPLQTIDKMEESAENRETPLFVYCHSGARSRQAVRMLQHMGYTNVKNLGGITAYYGKVER